MSGIIGAADTSGSRTEKDLIVQLMDEIVAGRTALDDDSAAEDQRDWYTFYRSFFPGRVYPRAQAFLNSATAREFLPPGYLYGTAVLVRHDPCDIRLIHLLDSERFLYFRTTKTWSGLQFERYHREAELRRDLWAHTDLSTGAGVGAELRQICRKYAVSLGRAQDPSDRGARLLSSKEVARDLKDLAQHLAGDLEGHAPDPLDPSPPGRQDIASFALLDLFDLDYLIQLRSSAPAVRAAVRQLASSVCGDSPPLVDRADPTVAALVPRWCRRGDLEQVVLFPFASQSLTSSASGERLTGDDVMFIGFLGARLDLCDPETVGVVNRFRTVANLIIATSLNELRRLLVLEEARHSSVAAIMGRNLSHNIGSHVLHWLVVDEEKTIAAPEPSKIDTAAGYLLRNLADEVTQRRFDARQGAVFRMHFLRYMRARMDYVATATRRMPWWSNSLSAKTLADPFTAGRRAHERYAKSPEQTLLLRNLVRSDGMEDVIVTQTSGAGRDVRVAIPHGWVGRQAFNTILENIIRNAAKHRSGNTLAASRDEFKVSFIENPEHPDFLEVQIADDLSSWDASAASMQEALGEAVCDREGRPMLSRLGFKEMRISAAFLRMIDPARVDDLHYPDLITLRKHEGHVAHVFYLWRAREVLVLAEDGLGLTPDQLAASRRAGVTIVGPNSRELERMPTYRFVLLLGGRRGEVAAWLARVEAEQPLPVRLMHSQDLPVAGRYAMRDDEVRDLVANVRALAEDADGARRSASAVALTVKLYDIWLEHHYGQDARLKIAVGPPPGWAEHVPGDVIPLPDQSQETDAGLDAMWKQIRAAAGSNPVGVIARHWFDPESMDRLARNRPAVRFIEGYSGNSAFQRFLATKVDRAEAALYVRELREAMLARILLIDERLAGDVKPGVSPAPELLRDRARERHKGVWLRGAEVVGMVRRSGEDLTFEWDEDVKRRFMFVGIHYGIIEKIARANEMRPDDCTRLVHRALHGIAQHVVVFSGRGRPDLPPNVRFVDYTSLEGWFREGKRGLVVGFGGL